MPGNTVFLSSGDVYVGELLELHKGVDSNFKRVCGISFEMLQWESASSHFEGRIPWFSSRFGRKFGVPLEL